MQSRVIIIIIAVILFGCSRSEPDARLMEIEDLASEAPLQALDSLNAIDYAGLSDADRHYYDFLMVKVPDKAYVTHTSDSLILTVIDYYRSHKSRGLYPEALYYGARVYSDLGDNPTAMLYFQEALEALPEQSSNLDLERRIASQYARLLVKLRLYDEAIPYMDKVLETDLVFKDSINEVHDLHLLGTMYMYKKDCKSAEKIFLESLSKSAGISEHLRAKSMMYLAELKECDGDMDAALKYIRGVPEHINPIARNHALAIATHIYANAEIADTAYLYALQLINSNENNNKSAGFQVLLSPGFERYVNNIDTLKNYITQYRDVIEKSFDENSTQMTVAQQALYNYRIHQREREKAEKENSKLWTSVFLISFALMAFVIIFLILKIRNRNNIIRLRRAFDIINQYESKIAATKQHEERDSDDSESPDINKFMLFDEMGEDETTLRQKLRDKLTSIYNQGPDKYEVSQDIVKSNTYASLMQFVKDGKELKSNDSLWKEIENTVLKVSPRFRKNLELLLGGRLSSYDLQTALLIKCGITPTQMKKLFNREKGTIASRRKSMGERIFDDKSSTKVVDGIIRLL